MPVMSESPVAGAPEPAPAEPAQAEAAPAETVLDETGLAETGLAETGLAETGRVPVVSPPPPPPPPAGMPPAGLPGGPEPSAGGGRVPSGAIPGGAAPGGAAPGWAGGGSARNAAYAGYRLEYERIPEATFDPLGNRRFLICLVRQASVFLMIYAIGAFITGIPVFILSLLGLFFLGIIWYVCAVLIALGLFIAFLVIPVPALLSEWKYLIDDKGAAGQATLGHIYYALQRRRTPLDSAGLRRLGLPGGESRDYLELRRGIFTGYISCFAQGNDLFVSWTFWLKLTPARFAWMLITRVFQEITQRGNDLYVTLRYESAKAMRESMHSAAHEGIDVATGLLAAGGTADLSALAVSTTPFSG
jgi:hypothetical protein